MTSQALEGKCSKTRRCSLYLSSGGIYIKRYMWLRCLAYLSIVWDLLILLEKMLAVIPPRCKYTRCGFRYSVQLHAKLPKSLVFVHGLRGDPRTTWSKVISSNTTAKDSSVSRRKCFRWWSSTPTNPPKPRSTSEFCWPRDDLPKRLPNVQVLLYGYEADVIGLFQAKSQNTITTHGNNFLIALERKLPKDTPIIFIAHSLGGILVKDVCGVYRPRDAVRV